MLDNWLHQFGFNVQGALLALFLFVLFLVCWKYTREKFWAAPKGK